jgi:hypothetical protein
MQAESLTAMLNEIFIIILFLALMLIFRWAFRTLPDEEWQIISCFPYKKLSNGSWQGWNLTWYGFFNSFAILFAVSVMIILLGAVSTPILAILMILITLLLICMPAARMIAFLIEKKQNTSTVGGASFVGIIIAPWIILVTKLAGNHLLDFSISSITVLSAMSIAYAFGEGIGRLACISFGCCYGKPLKEFSPLIQKIFHRYNFIFTGKTKKIAYAQKMDGQQVMPVQAITTLIYSFSGLIGCYLFFEGFTATAFVLTISVTQIWRFLSEFLRADHRGEGKISAYQKMALFSCLYCLVAAYIFHENQRNQPDLILGLSSLWNPALLLFLIGLWVVTFFYTGKSKVTSARIDINVHEDKI